LSKFLANHGLPQPLSVVLAPGESAVGKFSALKFPVLAKPPLARGGSGIRRFENAKELEAFIADRGKEQHWVVQEFIQGSDLCVNVLCKDGQIIASTVQHAIVPSAEEYAPSAGFEFRSDPAALDVARTVVEKLGWSGIANFDMRFDAQRNTNLVLEINGRYWLSMLGSLHAGVNFPLLACEAAFGSPKSNREVNKTRYFSKKMNAVTSLFGGGSLRIRPDETDLGYFLHDPVRLISVPAFKLVRTAREKCLTLQARQQRLDQSESNATIVEGDF
jgi:predicted ATP-grasp superfamily ATP-dependent carboligase